MGGGLVADTGAAAGTGAAPLLNSAQRGHLRLVSVTKKFSHQAQIGKKIGVTYSCGPSDHNGHNASERAVSVNSLAVAIETHGRIRL